MAESAAVPEPWALALFRRSVLKQRKYAEIARALGPTEGLRCLDLGSDNGVVSLLLRRGGGRWASADLTEEAVASIRGLVTSDVHLTDGARLPFADAEFDRVASLPTGAVRKQVRGNSPKKPKTRIVGTAH